MPSPEIPRKAEPLLTSKARYVVLIGGRSSAKSETVARVMLGKAQCEGADVLCGREFQSSIDESVHKLLAQLIGSLEVQEAAVTDKKIDGPDWAIRFKGLARNPDGIKSFQDFKYSWIEEAQSLSQESLRLLLPTIRASDSQLYFTANPMSSADPFSKRFILPFQKELQRDGYYEDDLHLIIVMNWRDNPWHSELEEERLWDYENLDRAEYDHIWEGAFYDTVPNAIIKAEWFDACVDAHKKLGFKPLGQKVVIHDPADSGDARTIVYRHGSVILDVQENLTDDVNDSCDWATDYAIDVQADKFVWDCDGLGISLRKQVTDALNGKRIEPIEFRGSAAVSDPGKVYQPVGKRAKAKTNKQSFKNRRAQCYWGLRDKVYKTYRAVEKGEYCDPDELLSISSDIEVLPAFRAEMCRIPRKRTGLGVIQIMSKDEMLRQKPPIQSPNMADGAMMSVDVEGVSSKKVKIKFATYA